MTLVAGFNWFTETVIMADTRVSWVRSQRPPKDILRKLYTFGDSRKSIVLGFSTDDLRGVVNVMSFLMLEKLVHYKRRWAVAQIKEELRGWIEEAACSMLTPVQRRSTRFMLCGIEPSRHPPLRKNGKVFSFTPFVESHVYVYQISEKGSVYVNSKPKRFAVIGKGSKVSGEILREVKNAMRFGWGQQNLQWARAVLIGDIVSKVVQDEKEVSASTGGPFQVIRIAPTGLETQYVWPSGDLDKNVEVRYEGSKVIIRNPSLDHEYVLHPIWEFPFGIGQ